jgi:hypothetical protein
MADQHVTEQAAREQRVDQTVALIGRLHGGRFFRPEHFGDLTPRERDLTVELCAEQPPAADPVRALTRRELLLCGSVTPRS